MSPSKPWRTVLLGESTGRFSREQIRAAVLAVKAESAAAPGSSSAGYPLDGAGLEALLRDSRDTLDRISASLGRRHGLPRGDADDFATWARSRLVKDDYAILRKHRGESALATYLTVVASMLFREYRVRAWGRWRPSAAARRLGPLAIRLETLLHRDGCTLAQAGEVIRGGGEDVSDRLLADLLARLPPRHQPHPVRLDPEAMIDVDDRAGLDEADRARRRTDEALFRSLERLPSEDRMIVQMRFWEEMSVADIARALNLEQKPLYRRINRIHARLRAELAAEGATAEQVREMFDDRR